MMMMMRMRMRMAVKKKMEMKTQLVMMMISRNLNFIICIYYHFFFLYFSFFDACFVFLLFQNLEFFLLCKENVKKSISPVFMIFLMFCISIVSEFRIFFIV